MEANEHYWRGAPKIKKIIWLVVQSPRAGLRCSKRARLTSPRNFRRTKCCRSKDSQAARPVAVRGNRLMWLILNNKMKPFDDVRVRQAINYLVPRDEIVKNVYHGMAKAWSGVISDVTPGYENLKPYDFDPDKAKKLLADAGYGDGFEADLLFSAGVPEMENLAVILQSTAGKLGVKLNLKKLPVAAFSDTVQSKKAQMALWIDSPIQPDVNYVVNLVYSTGPLALVNYDQFSDPAVDKLIETGASIVDPKARLEHHKGVQAKIQEGAPMGYTIEPYFRIGLSRNIEGFHWYTTQYYLVSQMSFIK